MSDICEDSFVTLMTQICNQQLGQPKKVWPIQPETTHQVKRNSLRKRAFDVFFEHLWDPERAVTDLKDFDEHSLAYGHAFELRSQRKFDKASRLEHLVDAYMKGEDKPLQKSVLRLLLILANSSTEQGKSLDRHNTVVSRRVLKHEGYQVRLPGGSLLYGDTDVDTHDRIEYMCYSPSLFRVPGMKMQPAMFDVFRMKPGTPVVGRDLYNMAFCPRVTAAEQPPCEPFMGSLVQKKRLWDPDTRLELPELQSPRDLTLPKLHQSASDSEGFVDYAGITLASGSDDSGICENVFRTCTKEYDEDIWDLALEPATCSRYTWEARGRCPRATERAFLTEAGREIFDKLYDLRREILHHIDPSMHLAPRQEVTSSELVRDILYVLIGCTSHCFLYDQTRQRFEVTPGVCVSGMGPEALGRACYVFIECGSHYARLEAFAHPAVLDSFYQGGLILQAFKSALRKYLQFYRACILSLPTKHTFLRLSFMISKLAFQMRYLARLCFCAVDVPENDDPQTLPTGLELLSYLYKETLAVWASHVYPVMLSLFKTSCEPYLTFVRDWVFDGTCLDRYGEFMIQINHDYLVFKDKYYWTHGYVQESEDASRSVPLFLSELANDIFVCGKSINLLRLCCESHFLFTVEASIPRVAITLSQVELRDVQKQCQVYLGRMQQIARQKTLSRAQLLARTEQTKQDLIRQVRQTTADELRRIQDRTDEINKAQDAKKRKHFAELKQQMVNDLDRRAGVVEADRAADKVMMIEKANKHSLQQKLEERLEQEARQSLVAHYETLSAAATEREQHALWRVRRHRLNAARTDFLLAEEARLRDSIAKATLAGDDIADEGPSAALPDREREGLIQEPEGDPPKWPNRDPGPLSATVTNVRTRQLGDPPRPDPSTWSDVTTADDVARRPVESLERLTNIPIAIEDTPLPQRDDRHDAAGKATGTASGDKPQIRVYQDQRATTESMELDHPTHIKLTANRGATVMSDPGEEPKPQVRQFSDRHASQQSKASEEPPASGVKRVGDAHVNKQSNPADAEARSGIRVNPELNPSQESSAGESVQKTQVRMSDKAHATKESEVVPEIRKSRNIFGHVSDLCRNEFEVQAPRMKRVTGSHVSVESQDLFTYQVKAAPRIRRQIQGQSVGQESGDGAPPRSQIHINRDQYASKESVPKDEDALRLKRFHEQNVHGHTSDSSVQKLLYGQEVDTQGPFTDIHSAADFALFADTSVERFADHFCIKDAAVITDLISAGRETTLDIEMPTYGDEDTQNLASLSILLKKSVTAPLTAQISLVNQCITDHFLVELRTEQHFAVLRRYLLMYDGEFSQSLTDQLFERLATHPKPQEMLNPVFLNLVLSRALQSSLRGDEDFAGNLSFVLKHLPRVLIPSAPDALDCLELTYKVEWPVNIVITETSLKKYGQVFSFMLQLKWVVWALHDVWYRLKRDALIYRGSETSQFRQLQLFRHEMQHCVKVMHDYIANQITHVTWREFQNDLATRVHNLDDLHDRHGEHLNKCLFRCLLNKKAAPVMKVIQGIFGLILKFRSQLVSQPWHLSADAEATHPVYSAMCTTYNSYVTYSRFLYKVVSKLSMRGYQPHLQEILLRLDFNGYYSATTN